MVGSIGVVMLHVDQSVRDAKQGVTYTPIYAGDRKVDFSSHAPISDAALAIAQDEVNRVYDLFVSAVAAHRGMDEQAVRDTQAGLFHAQAAADVGLIDAVESFDATLKALATEAQRFRVYGPRASAQLTKGVKMDKAPDKPAAGAATATTVEQLAEAQARGFTEGKAEGTRIGMETERGRISAILTHAEATDRRALAEHLAFKTTNTVEDAAALLAAAPKSAATTNLLAATMDKVGNPKVAADAGDEAPKKTINAADIYKRRLAAVK